MPETTTGQPENCDLLIVNGHVLTMDGKRDCLCRRRGRDHGHAHCRRGPYGDIEKAWQATRRIRCGWQCRPSRLHRRPLSRRSASQPRLDYRRSEPTEGGGRGGPGVFTRWINALTDEDEYASALMAVGRARPERLHRLRRRSDQLLARRGCRGSRSCRHPGVRSRLHAVGHRRRRADGGGNAAGAMRCQAGAAGTRRCS